MALGALSLTFVAGGVGSARAQDAAIIDLDGRPPRERSPAAQEPAPTLPIIRRDGPVAEATKEHDGLAVLPLEPRNFDLREPLVGDFPVASYLLHLPAEARPDAFVLTYRSSIDVLPDRSSLTVIVNGTALPPIAPQPSDTFETVTLQTSALQSGVNDIRVVAHHHHRVFCGAEASYGLWTEIDPARSGALASDPLIDLGGAGWRSALAAQAAAGESLEIRYGPMFGPVVADRVYDAITAAARGIVTDARATSVWSPAGAGGARTRVTVIRGPVDALDIMTGGDGALVARVMLASDDTSWLAARLGALLATPDAGPALPTLSMGAPVMLSDLGVTGPLSLKGNIDRETLRFVVPGDWLAPAAQRADLSLHYKVDAGFADGAVMTVAINGQSVQLLPLDTDQPPESPLAIPFDPGVLRRGVNTLAIEIMVPGAPADRPCAMSGNWPTATILASTTLDVPGSVPITLGGIAPALLGVSDVTGSGDAQATADLATRAPFNVLAPLGDAPPSHLHVITVDDLHRMPLGDLAIDHQAVARTLQMGASGLDTPDRDPTAWIPQDWRDANHRLQARLQTLDTRPLVTSLSLNRWLEQISGRAVLLQPMADDPGQLWLVLGDGADSHDVAASLQRARFSGTGPDGQVSVLGEDGMWINWFARNRPPRVLAPVDAQNVREIVAMHASWSPAVFVLGGLGATWVSALVGVVMVRLGRKREKR